MTKKFIAGILAFSMILGCAVSDNCFIEKISDDVSVSAEELTTGKCGENVTYSFDSATGTLTISGTGDMDNHSFGSSPFNSNKNIKKIIIENGVTSIGEQIFEGCYNLTDVTIPKSVTNIGDSAFLGCHNLAEITIPDSVKIIGVNAFTSCDSLTSITIPAGVESIGYGAFSGCGSLTEINVVSENNCYCSEDGVVFNKDKTKLVRFPIAKNSTEYSIPNSVLIIDSDTFGNCRGLAKITIPDSVTKIKIAAFFGCTNLTEITISDGVTSIEKEAFVDCTNLKEITIPKSVTSIGKCAFGYYYDFEEAEDKKIDDFKIYGYTGTDAERYAKENEFEFIALDEGEEPPVTEPTVTTTETTTATEETAVSDTTKLPEPVMLGDATGDNVIDVRDVAAIAQYLVKLKKLDLQSLGNADINRDGVVNIADLTHLKRYLMKDIESL